MNPFSNYRSEDYIAMQASLREDLPATSSWDKELVHARISLQALASPNRLAICEDGSELSFSELEATANRLAQKLHLMGVQTDTAVGICMGRSSWFVIAALAVLKAGGAYVCLDPDYPRDRLAFMLTDLNPAVVLATRHSAAYLPAGQWPVLTVDDRLDPTDSYLRRAPAPNIQPNDLAYFIYTSGSTGIPKGTEITHGSLCNLIDWHQSAFKITASDRATQLSSLAFDAAVWEIWPHLTAGASLHIPNRNIRTSPELLRDWLLENRITISFVPTPLAERLLVLPWPKKTNLRLMLTGADTLHMYPASNLPFTLVNNYGPTECTVVATSGPVIAESGSPTIPPIGRAIKNTEIYILDSEMHPVSEGEVGEIYIGGAGLARGYHARPDLTAASFVPHPFSSETGARLYRTGDWARYLPDGQIGFVGRRDEQIKIRGFRVEPDEITAILNRHPAIQVSFVAAHGAKGTEQLVAYILAGAAQEPSASELRDHLAKHLPDYMIPSLFVRLQSLPLTVNGKVDRAALPQPNSGNIVRDDPTALETAIEKDVAAIVSGLLGLEEVGCDENFFLLGGHSLLGMQLITKIQTKFRVELSLLTLFGRPTIRALASEIERLVLVRPSGVTPSNRASVVSTLPNESR
jgi:amino acid adenylation domain-containing protein